MALEMTPSPRATRKRSAISTDSASDAAASVPTAAAGHPPGGGSPAPFKMVKSELHREIYCNHVRMTISQWDLGLLIGEQTEGDDGSAIVRQDIAVKFSPPFFKSLVESLVEALRLWEGTFGEIPTGPGQSNYLQGMSGAFETLRSALEAKDKEGG